MDMIMKNHPHPGEVLREVVLEPLGISVTEAARRLGVSRVALSRVVNGRAAISTDLAIRLEAAGAGTARSWLTMQTHYELSCARERGQPAVEPLRAA